MVWRAMTERGGDASPASGEPISSIAIGVAGGMVLVGIWSLLYGFSLAPFPPYDLADLAIRAAPGAVATRSIETLGHNAQRIAMASGTACWIALWAIATTVQRRASVGRAALVPAGVAIGATVLGSWSEGWPGSVRMLWIASAFGIAAAATAWITFRWHRLAADERASASPTSATPTWLDAPGDASRRALVRQIAGVTLLAGVGGGLLGSVLRRSEIAQPVTAAGLPLDVARTLAPATPQSVESATELDDAFPAPAGVRPRTTPVGEFYVVDISTRDPRLPEMDWTLRIHGLVERELSLTWADLLAAPAVEFDGTLMCISYEHDSGLVSSTRWTGVRLRDVLQRAGIRDGVVDVICRGANGYSDSIPLTAALDENTVLAYAMDGRTLPTRHGFPCRLYVPGLYGEKNVKWLQEIELSGDDYLGYWQERGWTDIATVQTMSAIDTPRGEVVPASGGLLPVGGIAFAGTRGISSVQVQIDDGSWQPAELEPYDPHLVWQRWRMEWTPEAGRHRLSVRATDGDGNPQVESQRDPHPDGMTGLHQVVVQVRSP